jgi:hypothetical protein
LKKDKSWDSTKKYKYEFGEIKCRFFTTLVLKLPEFEQSFEVQIDILDFAIGGVLTHDEHPVSFERRKVQYCEQRYLIDEKEMTAVVHCLQTWRHYLLGNSFVMKTNNIVTSYFAT